MIDVIALRRRYLRLCNEDGINKQDLDYIENNLELILPDDFKDISRFYNGGCLGVVDNYCFKTGEGNNIIEETKRLRDVINLPKNFIVLAEPAESIIVMDVVNKPSIIWCDATDIYNLRDKSFVSKPDLWQDYSDFFNKLLSEEEEDNGEI